MTPAELIQSAISVESQGVPVNWKEMCVKVFSSANDAIAAQDAKVKGLEADVTVLAKWKNDAFRAHKNIDVDIESLPKED